MNDREIFDYWYENCFSKLDNEDRDMINLRYLEILRTEDNIGVGLSLERACLEWLENRNPVNKAEEYEEIMKIQELLGEG